MKKGIHPKYELAIIRCACGSEIETRTTKPGFNVEICSSCHPFFTGKQKLMDTAGRVDRFRKRYGLEGEATTAESIARAAKARPKTPATTKKVPAGPHKMTVAKKMAAKARAEAAEAEKEAARAPVRKPGAEKPPAAPAPETA